MVSALSFANPGFLWLAPLALLVAWWWRRRPRPAMRFSDLSRFGARTGARAALADWGSPILRGLTCLGLVIACAGPRRPDTRTQLPAEGIAIVMALDVSGSMGAEDVPWNPGSPPVSRLEAARRALKLFLAGGDAPDGTPFKPRPGDSVGLVVFAAVPETACPATLNHSVLFKVADGLKPKEGLDAGTNIGDALAEAVLRLDAVENPKQARVLILLSDGEHNVFKEDVPDARRPGIDRTLKPREAAQLAANLNIKVYTIDAGGDPPPGAPPEAVSQRIAGRQSLKDVADMTGGKSFHATSGAELLAAYHEIGELEKGPEAAPIYRKYFEDYVWFAGAALVLLLTAHVLDRTLWRAVT
ncbi:MAG TPA: VWA domain-containing protein [Gemmata sp.]